MRGRRRHPRCKPPLRVDFAIAVRRIRGVLGPAMSPEMTGAPRAAGAWMRATRFGLLCLSSSFLAVSGAGCLTEPSKAKVDREVKAVEAPPIADPAAVIAEVNGKAFTRGEYYTRILKKFGTMKMLTGFIKEELFLQEAARRKVTVPREEVEARTSELLAQEASLAGGEARLREIYRAQGLSIDDLRREMAADVERQLLLERTVRSLRVVDEKSLRDYWQQTWAKTRYHVRHIAYRYPLQGYSQAELARRKLEAREKAERSAKRIREGTDFAEVARQESDDVTRESGGDLGIISEDQEMEPAMKEALLKLKPMEVSDPIENNLMGAYHVVQITEVLPHKSFAESQEAMRKEIAERPPDENEVLEALTTLWKGATIRIFGEEVKAPEAAGDKGEKR